MNKDDNGESEKIVSLMNTFSTFLLNVFSREGYNWTAERIANFSRELTREIDHDRCERIINKLDANGGLDE